MQKRKISAAILSVFSSVMLIFAMVVPAFAADQTVTLQTPTDWTGPSAGTNQTGIPYSWFYLVDCTFRSEGNQYPPTSTDNANFQNMAYIAVNPDRSDQDEINLNATLLESVNVVAGQTYTLNFRLGIDGRNSAWETVSGVAFVTVSLGGNVVIRKSFSSNSIQTLETEVLVAQNSSLDQLEISIDFGEPVSGVWIRLGWCKVLIRDSTGEIITEIQSGTQQIIDNQNTGTQQIIDNQNANTDKIISGDGLTDPNGVDDSELSGAIQGEADANAAIDDALGGVDAGAQLEEVMDSGLDDNITGAFKYINQIFSRVVTTLDISAVMTFLLVFALAMYVIGRRTS